MAKGKKGALYQLFVPMVDATDFASIESAITASDFNSGVTAKFYGMNHGGSAATTSGTISKAASLVRSGVFRVTLKTTENNYDVMMARFNKTGCAEQIFVWENVDNDDSDIMSAITLLASVVSDAHSAAILGASHASDALSAVGVANSRILLVQSRLSDFDSRLVSDVSDTLSAVAVANSRILLVQSRLSDFDSRLVSDISDLKSALAAGVPLDASTLSDLRSAITAGGAISASDMSDIASRVWATTIGARVDSRILVIQSMASDAHSAAILGASHASDAYSAALIIQSQLSDFDSRLVSDISDVRSAIALIPVAVSASDMSDIASRVWATTIGARVDSRILLIQSMTSDAHSAATLGASRILVVQSRLSDLDSRLVADVSDLASKIGNVSVALTASDISDIASAVAAAVTTVTPSDISDIASAVWAHVMGARVDSRLLLVQSRLSDLDSRLVSDISDLKSALAAGVPLDASTMSDIRSAITAGGAAAITVSDISDIASAVWANVVGARVDSRLLVAQSMASDAHSAATVAGSRALVVQSRLSDLDSRLVSDISDVRSQLDVIQSMASDAHSAAILGASHASDAHSAATQAASRALLNQSRISDVYSLLSDVASDLTVMSGVLSDVYSAIGAGVEIGASSLSDLRSAITANGVLAAGAEPAAVPAHTASMSAKVDWLTALARNKITQTATKQVLRNGSDTATLASATVSDDGTTFTRSEWL